MPTYEELRQAHGAEVQRRIPALIDALTWPAERLRAERHERLRSLVRAAKDRSPWHRERLADVDADRLTENELARLPVMTKTDLMAHWDEIVTDRRLTLDLVERHLERLRSGDAYLFDEFHAVASGGSSGQRGIFVYDFDGWALGFGTIFRHRARHAAMRPPSSQSVSAFVLPDPGPHLSISLAQTFFPREDSFRILSAALPLERLVAELNQAQPTALNASASVLAPLVEEARAGRLTIAPGQIGNAGEPLSPALRRSIVELWNPTIFNAYNASEAPNIASSCGVGEGMHLVDDWLIVEPVDELARAVVPGVLSAKLLLTNLYNTALPLIRYELTDQVMLIDGACECGSTHRRIADVQFRSDDVFAYDDGATVEPSLFHDLFQAEANVTEYQVRQTQRGAEIAIVPGGRVDVERLRANIAHGLRRSGLTDPDVAVRLVETLERTSVGKLRQYVRLR